MFAAIHTASTRACASSSRSKQAHLQREYEAVYLCTVPRVPFQRSSCQKKGVPRRAHALSRPSSVHSGSPPSPSSSTHTPSLALVPLSLSCFHTLPISPFAFIPSFCCWPCRCPFFSPALSFSLLPFLSFPSPHRPHLLRQAPRRRRPSFFDSRQRSRACKPIPRENPSAPNPSPRFMSGRL